MIVTRLAFVALAAGAATVGDPAKAQIITAKEDGTITTASIVAFVMLASAIVGIAVGVMTILRSNKAARREAEKEAEERTNKIMGKIEENRVSMDDRVKSLEIRSERFLPGDIIEQRIDHLKANRVQVELRQQEQLKELDRNVHSLCTQVAKLEERGESMAKSQSEIKDLVRELRTDMKAGFDKLTGEQRRAA